MQPFLGNFVYLQWFDDNTIPLATRIEARPAAFRTLPCSTRVMQHTARRIHVWMPGKQVLSRVTANRWTV